MKFTCFLFLYLFFAIHIYAQSHHVAGPQDKPSTHGMLIFGTEKIYASHLPLFHSPHNYQILLELQLDDKSTELYSADQLANPQSVTYTVEPEKFVLPDKIISRGNFNARLYRGHFERGGIKIADSVSIKIVSVIYFRELNTKDQKNETTDFILFGNSKEQYAAHFITNAPDFEQVIQVDAAKLLSGNNALFKVITFSEKENSPIGVSGNTIETADMGNITLLRQVYLEFEDLKK